MRKGEGRRSEEEGGGGREKEEEREEEEWEEEELSLIVVNLGFAELLIILLERLCRRSLSFGLKRISDFRGEDGLDVVGVLKIGLLIKDLFNLLWKFIGIREDMSFG